MNEGEGCDLPYEGLRPVMLSRPDSEPDFKPEKHPAWWPVDELENWLLGQDVTFNKPFLDSPTQEMYQHVCIEPTSGAARENFLFASSGLIISHMPRFPVDRDKSKSEGDRKKSWFDRHAEVTLTLRLGLTEMNLKAGIFHPLGGKRRLAHWQPDGKQPIGWACPSEIREGLKNAQRIRMVLATPALFECGWQPGWLNADLEGCPPGTDVKLRLVGVANTRWKALSRWSLAKINNKGELDSRGKPGPKPLQRMVPAGSVYFFELVKGDPSKLAERWLRSVSDDEQDQRDGFGLAVWGTW
jgi:CRISPR-associated protein Cmr3